jgi:hypothetical protein
MSKESKETLEKMKRLYKTVEEGSKELSKEAGKLGDKELKTKIEKVEQGAKEVTKHIEERSGKG